MKATIDIPDEIYRKVRAKAAEEGRKIREVMIELFQLWLAGAAPGGDSQRQDRLRSVMERHVGCFDSGIDDLAGNPKHQEGFGDDPIPLIHPDT